MWLSGAFKLVASMQSSRSDSFGFVESLGLCTLVLAGNFIFYWVLYIPAGADAVAAEREADRLSARNAALADGALFGGSSGVGSPARAPKGSLVETPVTVEGAKSLFLGHGALRNTIGASAVGVDTLVALPDDAPKLPSSPSGAQTVRFSVGTSVSGGSGAVAPQSK